MDIVKYCGATLELTLLYRNANEDPRFFLVECAFPYIKSFEILCKNMHYNKYACLAPLKFNATNMYIARKKTCKSSRFLISSNTSCTIIFHKYP